MPHPTAIRPQNVRNGPYHARMTDAPSDELLDLRFSGEIWHWRGPAPFYFVTVPEEASHSIQAVASAVSYGWGMIPVTARIGATTWTTSLFPKDGLYVLPLKTVVRRAEGLDEGDVITAWLAPGGPDAVR